MDIFQKLGIVVAFAGFIASCDTVSYNDAYEKKDPVGPVIPIDTTNPNDTTNPTDTVAPLVLDYSRKVLIEDYTGHTCGNCPYAAEEAHRIENLYAGKVIVMGIHCGFFAEPKNYPNGSFATDFRTSVGDALDNKFKASAAGLPRGVVGRRKYNSSFLLLHSDWYSKADAILAEASPGVGIGLKPKYYPATRALVVETTVGFNKAVTGSYKVASYLLEDSIVTWQKIYPTPTTSQNIEFYKHNHVLRGGLLPANGVDVVSSNPTIAKDEIFKTTWQMVVPASVKPAKAKVVTIVYRADSEEVVQVEESKIL